VSKRYAFSTVSVCTIGLYFQRHVTLYNRTPWWWWWWWWW